MASTVTSEFTRLQTGENNEHRPPDRVGTSVYAVTHPTSPSPRGGDRPCDPRRPDAERDRRLAAQEAELAELARSGEGPLLEDEVIALRRKLADAPKRVRTLEERLLETKGQLAQAVSQNEKLSLHPAGGARAHRHPARGGRQAHPAAVGLRRGGRQERRRHRRRPVQRAQDAGLRAPRDRPRRARRGAGGRAQRELQRHPGPHPGRRRRDRHGARSSSRTASGPSSSAGPTRSGCASCPTPSAACGCARATRC